MADLATLKQWLDEAEKARHALLTGSKRETVRYQDRQVQFQRTDMAQLSAYIADLKEQIAKKEGRPRRGPIHPVP